MAGAQRAAAYVAAHIADAGSVFEPLWRDASVQAIRAGYYVCAPEWRLLPQIRPYYQLWLVERGTATITVGHEQFRLDPGTALLVPPELPRHGGHDPADPIRCHVLLFALRVLGSEAPAGLAALPPVLRLAPERWAAALRAAEEVYRELAGRQPGHTLLADSAMARLVGLLWREAATQDTLGRGTLPAVQGVSRLAPVFSYVAAHVTERLTLAELARLVHLSPAHFSTTFRRATGLSPFQYVQRYRLQRAKEILTEDSKSVGEVAAAVGFPDPSYFSRAFKRAEGLSPARYRMAKKSPLLP